MVADHPTESHSQTTTPNNNKESDINAYESSISAYHEIYTQLSRLKTFEHLGAQNSDHITTQEQRYQNIQILHADLESNIDYFLGKIHQYSEKILSPKLQNILIHAYLLATLGHREHVRKQSNIPYIQHLIRVTFITAHKSCELSEEELVSKLVVALLHDLKEDIKKEYLYEIDQYILTIFGQTEYLRVNELTKPDVEEFEIIHGSKRSQDPKQARDTHYINTQIQKERDIKLSDHQDFYATCGPFPIEKRQIKYENYTKLILQWGKQPEHQVDCLALLMLAHHAGVKTQMSDLPFRPNNEQIQAAKQIHDFVWQRGRETHVNRSISKNGEVTRFKDDFKLGFAQSGFQEGIQKLLDL